MEYPVRRHPPSSVGADQKSSTDDVVTVPLYGRSRPLGAVQANTVVTSEGTLYPIMFSATT